MISDDGMTKGTVPKGAVAAAGLAALSGVEPPKAPANRKKKRDKKPTHKEKERLKNIDRAIYVASREMEKTKQVTEIEYLDSTTNFNRKMTTRAAPAARKFKNDHEKLQQRRASKLAKIDKEYHDELNALHREKSLKLAALEESYGIEKEISLMRRTKALDEAIEKCGKIVKPLQEERIAILTK